MSWEIQSWGAKEGVAYDFATGGASTAANACSIAGAIAIYVLLAGAVNVSANACSVAGSIEVKDDASGGANVAAGSCSVAGSISVRDVASGSAAVPANSCSVAGSISSSYTFDANANQSAGLITLPSGLTITCATTSRTSQASASTRQGGYSANAARAFRSDSGAWYLLSEGESKNYTTDSDRLNDGANWTNYLTVVVVNANAGGGPDGVTNADEVDLTLAVNTAARYCAHSSGSANWSVSAWLKSTTGSAGNMQFENLTNGATQQIAITTTLGFYSWKYAGSNSMQEGISAGSGTLAKVLVSSVQSEKALYPQSYIPNVGNVQNTRAADVLAATLLAYRIPAGFFDATLVYAPLYAQNETAANHTLLYIDATSNLIYRQNDSKFVLTVNGVSVVSSAVTFSRNQALTVRVKHQSATGLSLIVSGATTGNGTTTGAAQPAVTPATVYLLGISTGSEEGAALRSYDWKTSVAA